MRFPGLHPDVLLAAARAPGGLTPPLPAGRSIAAGAAGFGAVSVGVFASWAWAGRWMYRHLGEGGAYAVWALLFVGGAGALLSRLVCVPAARWRFIGAFGTAFLAYAAAWTAAWFALRNAAGEWLGSAAGTLVLGLALMRAFGDARAWRALLAVLFAGHSAGYFAGSLLHGTLGGTAGKLAWGLCYGLGFGAGLGFAIHAVQGRLRDRLAAGPRGDQAPTAPPANPAAP